LATDIERRALEDDRFFSDEIARLRLLLEASSTLLGSLSVETMLPEILDLANRTLAADAYALWRRDAANASWSVAAYAGLPEEYIERATTAIRGQGDAILLEEPLVAEDIATADWIGTAHRQAHEEAGTRAMLVSGLRYGDRVLGTLVFYYRRPRTFSESEKNAASLLANIAAAAIGTAELYETQRRLAEDQVFVAQASELLASSLEYERTLSNVAALAVPQFADWCTIRTER
jgi:GAF domain-containing protein